MPTSDGGSDGMAGRRFGLAWPVAAAAAALFAAPASHGQDAECRPRAPVEPSPILVGECRTSSLGEQKDREEYTVRLSAKQIVQVDMRSEALQPLLLVRRPLAAPGSGGDQGMGGPSSRLPPTLEGMVGDDQSVGGGRARLRFEAETAGDYRISAMTYPGEKGSYSLRVREASRSDKPEVDRLISLSRREPTWLGSGRFGLNTARSGEDAPYAEYEFELDAPTLMQIEMNTSEFDPLLRLTREGDPSYALEDDDGGEGRNARLVADLPAGRYRIQATSPGEAEGFFKIGVQRLERSPPDRNVRVIETNLERGGELSLSKSGLTRDDTGKVLSLHQDFTVKVRPGKTYTVEVKSAAFDPVLDAGMLSAIGFGTALTNDDSCDSANPRLVLMPVENESRSVVLRVRSFGTKGGPFRITVWDRLVECPPGGPGPTEGS